MVTYVHNIEGWWMEDYPNKANLAMVMTYIFITLLFEHFIELVLLPTYLI
jgi:hypothetical protein